MYNHVLFIIYWIITATILYIIHIFYPTSVVLGNHKFVTIEAAVYSAFWISFIMWTILDVFYSRGFRFRNLVLFLIAFLAANSVSIWMVARFAKLLGLGIVSYQWAFAMAAVITVAERIAWQFSSEAQPERHKKK